MMTEFLARQRAGETGSARDLQAALEKRIHEAGFASERPEPEVEGRWPPAVTTLLVVGVSVLFWGGLAWAFAALFG
jgi:hypothetical protein